jgi:hypothetical protein
MDILMLLMLAFFMNGLFHIYHYFIFLLFRIAFGGQLLLPLTASPPPPTPSSTP